MLALEAARHDDGSVIALMGELDLCGASELETALDVCARDHDGRSIVIDLCDVRFIDVAGLHSLRRGCGALVEMGHVVFVRRARAQVQRVFELTHTTELFPFIG